MKILKVTNMSEMTNVLGANLNSINTQTSIQDIDDDVGDLQFDIEKAITPELPQRNFNIATLTPEKLEELRRSSK